MPKLPDETPKNFSIVYPDYKPSHKSDLGNWLAKEAMTPTPATATKDNENESVKGKLQVYEDPEGRESGTGEGPWGERPRMADGRHQPFHQNDATYAESKNVRRGVLDRVLATFKPAQQADQKLMSANFDHVRNGDFEAHSALLQGKTKTGARQGTLGDRVKALVGRF